MNTHIANELIEMAQHDLHVREKLLNEGRLSQGYNPYMERVHEVNAARLEEIIDTIGYPTSLKVGEEASNAAWLIVQHAISKPAFIRKCYKLIYEAGNAVNPQNFAYLYDRICYIEGRPQKYGTQFDERGMYPVESKAEMIRLRKELKLSIPDHNVIVEHVSGSTPEFHAENSEFNSWRKKVGWI
jgi:hypothetical protein